MGGTLALIETPVKASHWTIHETSYYRKMEKLGWKLATEDWQNTKPYQKPLIYKGATARSASDMLKVLAILSVATDEDSQAEQE